MGKCMREGCEAEATHVPRFRVPAEGWPTNFHTPCDVMIGIECCADHISEIKPEEIITDEIRKSFSMMMQSMNKAKPDFSRAEVVPLEMSSKQYRDFLKVRDRG